MEKEAENHSGKEKNRNGDLCKEKRIAFLLEWGRISLDKDLLMGDPSGLVQDPYKENNPNSKTMVILTNGPASKPLKVYDGYDVRSEIENSLFREAKQAWFIQRPSQNTKAVFRAHAYLTILTMALTTAYQGWMDEQDKLEQNGQDTGIRKFREKVKKENGNKLIIFDQDRYAIFDAYEVFILCGRNVLMPTGVPERITKEDILQKYSVQLE